MALWAGTVSAGDWRNIRNGLVVPDEGYADQPYLVQSLDGSNRWMLVLTTGPGAEGSLGQHLIATVSTNQGASWSAPVDIEPTTGPEASWGVPYITPSGRIYVFYTFNHLRLLDPNPVTASRQDVQGTYAYKYSDDFGATWSARYEIPYRQTSVDLSNYCPGVASGAVNLFWGTGKAIEQSGVVLVPFAKVGTWLVGDSEGWLVRSDNLMTETDPAQLHWDMAPTGEVGIKNAALGSVHAEQCAVLLENGALYLVYRTVTGSPAYALSSDGGATWTLPTKITYADGRILKTPRANCKVWKASNGKYLLWYHNNGTTDFSNRNPVWLAGGEEVNGTIAWSEPEIALFDPDPAARISYPDFVEHEGRYWITETQKSIARVHELDPSLLYGLWAQATNAVVATHGLQVAVNLQTDPVDSVEMPVLPSLSGEGGFTIEFWVRFETLAANQSLLDTTDDVGRGVWVYTTPSGALAVRLSDGTTTNTWDTDAGALSRQRWQHVAITVDGSADVISFVVNGRLLDGGTARAFGWTRLDSALGDVNGNPRAALAETLQGELGTVRIYDRPLRTSEAIGNGRAWSPPYTTRSVADSFRYDGRYEPDSLTPPPGNSVWTVFTNGTLDIVPNDPASGLADFEDHSGSARMAMTHTFTDSGFNAEPYLYEWIYRFRLKLVSPPTDNAVLMLFGVRNEGAANGKAIMLAFDTAGRLGFAHANGSGFQFSDLGGEGVDYADGHFHTFTVKKTDQYPGGVTVTTYVDDRLLGAWPYDAFEDARSTEGFGVWSSTPGTEHVVIDDVYFGSRHDGTVVSIR